MRDLPKGNSLCRLFGHAVSVVLASDSLKELCKLDSGTNVLTKSMLNAILHAAILDFAGQF